MGAINREDMPAAIQNENVDFRTQDAGNMAVAFVSLKKGTDMAPALAGLPDDLCPCPHWGYMLKGKVKMKTKTGDEFYKAGQAFYWSPGHAPEALEDSEYVDFSPSAELAAVLRHVRGEAS